MSITITMLIMGLILGFVGAGGSGTIIAILNVFFGIPIHTALGTSLAAMVFTTLSGAYSHYREGNVVIKTGVVVGLFGAAGSFIGSQIAQLIPGHDLKWMTASMLFLSAILLGFKIFMSSNHKSIEGTEMPSSLRFWTAAGGVGIVSGILAGTFGIGSTPFIQIGLLTFLGMTIQQSAGTTMLVILPIALIGSTGYYTSGNLDIKLFIEVVLGTLIGTYIGAKFTTRLHPVVLKTATIIMPIIGGLLLLLGF
ncbi:sulfite exporter TauE/SafE family protein [Scopulibacillus cellulosilyticus]|uniref:Probable membrane transporter protein n=1 Tax=Scopulibacillus cellulosilyticus TaxID=2665665 RepID=A0ABW2PT09_9BACL